MLNQNYPGIYIPGIPPKKAVGNKDIEFVVERRYFLERFFMHLSNMEYLHQTFEMKLFTRPEIHGTSNDIDKQLFKLEKPNSSELLALYKQVFSITDEQIEEYKDKSEESVHLLENTQNWLKKLVG